jgi:hypothetical protein
MSEDRVFTQSDAVEFNDLQTEFLSLRIGEDIPRLEIKRIRKITNKAKDDNLPGTDYKYLIETTNNKILMVRSWVLWRKIAAALQEAGRVDAILELRHNGVEDYTVRVIGT